MGDRRVVCWPDGLSRPDPWDDGCWESLDTANRYAPLWTAWKAFQHGEIESIEAVAASLGLVGRVLEDRNRPDWNYPPPSLEDLARITTDTWPAAGMDAPDVVLGPEALFASRAKRLVAVAGCAFVWTDAWPQSCFHMWCRGKPLRAPELRAQVRAVGLAPWSLWKVERRDEAWWLTDHSALGEFYQPDGPVTVLGAKPTGEGMAARVYNTPAGWVAHCAVDVPTLPPAEVVQRWIHEETWMARTVQPGITRESLLRKRPVLVRRSLERLAGLVI